MTMSEMYDLYLDEHKKNVKAAFVWMSEHCPQVLAKLDKPLDWEIGYFHDSSKMDKEEYVAYDNYFYGNRSYDVVKAFDYAWLHHIHNNPHHWQYWLLINDDGDSPAVPEPLKIPYEYVIEMICDWWSFSFTKGDLYEIFKWYDDHKSRIVLHPVTRKEVGEILKEIRSALDEERKEAEEENRKMDDQVGVAEV